MPDRALTFLAQQLRIDPVINETLQTTCSALNLAQYHALVSPTCRTITLFFSPPSGNTRQYGRQRVLAEEAVIAELKAWFAHVTDGPFDTLHYMPQQQLPKSTQKQIRQNKQSLAQQVRYLAGATGG